MKSIGRALLCALLLLSAPAIADDVSNGSWSTTDGSNNSAPPNGWPAGMFPNQVEPTARSNMGGVKRWWERSHPAITTTGSAGAYVLTPTNATYPTAYTQGDIVCAKANFTSVGADTLNFNTLGAKGIYVAGQSSIAAIAASTILSGAQFCVAFDGALNSGAGGWQLLSLTFPPGLGTAASKAASDGTKSSVASVSGAITSGHAAQFSDTSGTVSDAGFALGSAASQSASSGGTHNLASVQTVVVGHITGFSDVNGSISDTGITPSNVMLGSNNLADVANVNSSLHSLGIAPADGVLATRPFHVSTSGPSGTPIDGEIWMQY